MKIYLYNIIIMENYIMMCLPLIEVLDNCTNNICDKIYSLYNTIYNSINGERTYTDSNNKITRSHSDSKIKYSDIDNPDGWEMLQIRLV